MIISYFSALFLFLILVSFVWFAFSLYTRRNDIADIAWGTNAIFITLFAYLSSFVPFGSPQSIILILIILWGLRLTIHITKRDSQTTEDERYRRLRTMWGKMFVVQSYLFIFLAQTFLICVITLPASFVALYGTSFPWSPLVWVGVSVWVVGFLFEWTADRQLRTFLKNPAHKHHVLQSGLWAYSRHPNYFGESLGWWGIFLMTISFPYGWVAIISPLTITFLILKVSGIPPAERIFMGNPEYDAYKQRVSSFIPMLKHGTINSTYDTKIKEEK